MPIETLLRRTGSPRGAWLGAAAPTFELGLHPINQLVHSQPGGSELGLTGFHGVGRLEPINGGTCTVIRHGRGARVIVFPEQRCARWRRSSVCSHVQGECACLSYFRTWSACQPRSIGSLVALASTCLTCESRNDHHVCLSYVDGRCRNHRQTCVRVKLCDMGACMRCHHN